LGLQTNRYQTDARIDILLHIPSSKGLTGSTLKGARHLVPLEDDFTCGRILPIAENLLESADLFICEAGRRVEPLRSRTAGELGVGKGTFARPDKETVYEPVLAITLREDLTIDGRPA
jgi:hypothetical protein